MTTRPLRVGISPWRPSVDPCIISTHPSASCLRHPGLELEVLLIMLQLLNLNYTIVHTNIAGCGTIEFHTNGTSKHGAGLTYMLQEEKIDITGNACTLTEERSKRFAFGTPVFQARQIFVIKDVVQNKHNRQYFKPLSPFKNEVWLALLGTFMAVLLIRTGWSLKWNLNMKVYLQFLNIFSETRRGSAYESDSEMRAPEYPLFWQCFKFIWMLILGGFIMLYDGKVTSAMVDVSLRSDVPFHSTAELAAALASGKYQFLSFREPFRHPLAKTQDIEEKYQTAQRIYGYTLTKASSIYDTILMNRTTPFAFPTFDLLFVRDMIAYPQRGKFYVLQDDGLGLTMFSYLWRKNFKYDKLLKFAMSAALSLIPLINNYYFGPYSSLEINETQNISGETVVIGLKVITVILSLYLGFILASILVFVLEICSKKRYSLRLHSVSGL